MVLKRTDADEPSLVQANEENAFKPFQVVSLETSMNKTMPLWSSANL